MHQRAILKSVFLKRVFLNEPPVFSLQTAIALCDGVFEEESEETPLPRLIDVTQTLIETPLFNRYLANLLVRQYLSGLESYIDLRCDYEREEAKRCGKIFSTTAFYERISKQIGEALLFNEGKLEDFTAFLKFYKKCFVVLSQFSLAFRQDILNHCEFIPPYLNQDIDLYKEMKKKFFFITPTDVICWHHNRDYRNYASIIQEESRHQNALPHVLLSLVLSYLLPSEINSTNVLYMHLCLTSFDHMKAAMGDFISDYAAFNKENKKLCRKLRATAIEVRYAESKAKLFSIVNTLHYMPTPESKSHLERNLLPLLKF